jgi:hypothetical protein
MAAMEPGRDDSSKEVLRRKEVENGTAGRRFPSVNFDELNYEQRRAPYNRGLLTITDDNNDGLHRQDDPGRTPDTE